MKTKQRVSVISILCLANNRLKIQRYYEVKNLNWAKKYIWIHTSFKLFNYFTVDEFLMELKLMIRILLFNDLIVVSFKFNGQFTNKLFSD